MLRARRPLPREALQYAATDVHYLLHLAAMLARRLQQHPAPAAVLSRRLSPGPPETSALHATPSGASGSEAGSVIPAVVDSGETPGRQSGDGGEARGAGQEAPSAALQQAAARSQRVALRLYCKPRPEAAALAAAQSVIRRRPGRGAPPYASLPGGAPPAAAAMQAPPRSPSPARPLLASDDAAEAEEIGEPPHAFNIGGGAAGGASVPVGPGEEGGCAAGRALAVAVSARGGSAPGGEAGQAAAHAEADDARVGAAARDCVYALCVWRDRLARVLDEGKAPPPPPPSSQLHPLPYP